MAWPPTPLPVNFGNATVSLNTHPQSHNTTNAVINNDLVPQIEENRNKGVAAYNTLTTSGGTWSPENGIQDITGGFEEKLEVTWNATASRLYLITFKTVWKQPSGGAIDTYLTTSANVVVQTASSVALSPTYGTEITGMTLKSGLTGSITYKVRVQPYVHTATLVASATSTCQLLVQDIGAA